MNLQIVYIIFATSGYYCRSGAIVSTPEIITPLGVSTIANNTNCTCPECLCSVGAFNKSNAGPCPAGFYCTEGTDEPEPCPRGTFSNATKLQSIEQCYNCTEGQYCSEMNMTKPTGPCWPGYYCQTGASVANEIPCPAGRYCKSGTYVRELCPSGTYRNATNGKNITDCWECTGGKYCEGDGLTTPTGDCSPG